MKRDDASLGIYEKKCLGIVQCLKADEGRLFARQRLGPVDAHASLNPGLRDTYPSEDLMRRWTPPFNASDEQWLPCIRKGRKDGGQRRIPDER
jgi:hypothetical protein